MVGKGNLAVFESSSISETKEATPTKIGANTVGKGNLAVFERSKISEIKEAIPIKN